MTCSYILQINITGEPFLNVNCEHIKSFGKNLYRQLISYPQVRIDFEPHYSKCLQGMFLASKFIFRLKIYFQRLNIS